ncbi:MAG: DUF819 family protein [Bacillus subtilis]|nr:DUF819 family protein [Bacillus subtilis]
MASPRRFQESPADEGSNVVGHYLILLFSYALASSLDLSRIEGNLGRVMILLGMITILTFVFHALFSRLFKVDVDCAIVTMTAGLYSPAFVPAITSQLKNEALTVPGLICGSIGYAIGTFLGYLIGLVYLALVDSTTHALHGERFLQYKDPVKSFLRSDFTGSFDFMKGCL